MGLAMRRLPEGYGRKKRRARVKLAARTAADHRRGLGHDPLLGLARAAADRITRASKTTAKNRTGTIYTSMKLNARRPRHGWTARRVDRGGRGAATHNGGGRYA